MFPAWLGQGAPSAGGAMADLDWNLVQSFLETADQGSLSAAARRLGLSQPTVGRHVADLEAQLGVRLFDRTAGGLRITEVGLTLAERARAMRQEAMSLRRIAEGSAGAVDGTVRLTASEMVAMNLLAPILADLHLAEPRIQLEVVASMVPENLLLREADIALRMFRPQQNDVITRHVCNMRIGFFARRDYLDRRGRPAGLEDLAGHSLIGFDKVDALVRGFRVAGMDVDRSFFRFRSDCQSVGWEMVRAGFGIGVGPVFLGSADPSLEQVLRDTQAEQLVLPIWLTAHQDLRSSRRIRFVYDFLADRISALKLC